MSIPFFWGKPPTDRADVKRKEGVGETFKELRPNRTAFSLIFIAARKNGTFLFYFAPIPAGFPDAA